MRNTKVDELGHFQSRVTTRIDARIRFQIHVDIDGQSVITAAPLDAQAKRGDFATADVDARRAPFAISPHAPRLQEIDDRLLQYLDQTPYADTTPAEIEQDVDHELTGAMVGHLTPTVGAHDGDVAEIDEVLALPGPTEGEHGRMLEKPYLVSGVRAALRGELTHRLPGRAIIATSEVANGEVMHGATKPGV